jgi:lipoate-protein ligase A
LRPLIRRPTGGGIVPHAADWTYSLAFPPGHEWHSLKAEESYRRVHEWIQAAFAKLNVTTELAPTPNSELLAAQKRCEGGQTPNSEMGQCFAGHEKFDLLWQGRKIAGAAQRRNKLGLLIQGSVQSRCIGISPARTNWQKAMCAAGRGEFGIEWLEFKPDDTLRNRAEFLVRHKYSQMEFLKRR